MSGASPALQELRQGVRRYLSIKSSYSPQFSPDDRRLAYLSDLTGLPQVWMVGLDDGNWPQQLSLGQERVGFLSYAAKSDMIACGVDSGGDERFQIQIIEDGGERLGMVTNEPDVIHNWGDWSPDERSMCFSSNARNPSFFDIYTHSLDDGSQELVHQNDGSNYPVSWSPDGSSILFMRMHAPFNHDLYLLSVRDRSVELITAHDGDAAYYSPTFDPTGRFVYCVTDEGREFPALARIDVASKTLSYLYTENHEFEGLSMSRDGSKVAFIVNEDGYSRLMVWRVGTEALERVDVPRSVIGGLTWSNDGKKLAFSLSSSTTNSDLWLYDLHAGALRRVTRSSTCGIQGSSFVEAEPLRFKSFDGLEVPAFLYRPRAPGPVPLLVYLHGGPESQFRPGFNPLLQYFVRLGFAVLAPNFRGSTGYGRRFTHLDDVYGRMDTVKDAIAAVGHAQKMLEIDKRKIVAWGGSYGGFMVLACLYSDPDLWAAGVDIVGISNFVTFLRQTGPWRRKIRIAEYGDPDKDHEFLEKISPNNNAQLIKAPLFIIHGANDPRVPIGEATQIMETMQNLGREAHLMTFDDEGHGLVKLHNRIEGYSTALGFLMYRVTVAEQGPSPSPPQDGPR
jgi:dipeptidyl aminopeptidase/acylaminoacyl peptidase